MKNCLIIVFLAALVGARQPLPLRPSISVGLQQGESLFENHDHPDLEIRGEITSNAAKPYSASIMSPYTADGYTAYSSIKSTHDGDSSVASTATVFACSSIPSIANPKAAILEAAVSLNTAAGSIQTSSEPLVFETTIILTASLSFTTTLPTGSVPSVTVPVPQTQVLGSSSTTRSSTFTSGEIVTTILTTLGVPASPSSIVSTSTKSSTSVAPQTTSSSHVIQSSRISSPSNVQVSSSSSFSAVPQVTTSSSFNLPASIGSSSIVSTSTESSTSVAPQNTSSMPVIQSSQTSSQSNTQVSSSDSFSAAPQVSTSSSFNLPASISSGSIFTFSLPTSSASIASPSIIVASITTKSSKPISSDSQTSSNILITFSSSSTAVSSTSRIFSTVSPSSSLSTVEPNTSSSSSVGLSSSASRFSVISPSSMDASRSSASSAISSSWISSSIQVSTAPKSQSITFITKSFSTTFTVTSTPKSVMETITPGSIGPPSSVQASRSKFVSASAQSPSKITSASISPSTHGSTPQGSTALTTGPTAMSQVESSAIRTLTSTTTSQMTATISEFVTKTMITSSIYIIDTKAPISTGLQPPNIAQSYAMATAAFTQSVPANSYPTSSMPCVYVTITQTYSTASQILQITMTTTLSCPTSTLVTQPTPSASGTPDTSGPALSPPLQVSVPETFIHSTITPSPSSESDDFTPFLSSYTIPQTIYSSPTPGSSTIPTIPIPPTVSPTPFAVVTSGANINEVSLAFLVGFLVGYLLLSIWS